MTGTTPRAALPYPEPADRVRGGSLAIRALAESLDPLVASRYASLVQAASVPTANATEQVVGYTTVDVSDEFTYDGSGLLHYSGAPRWFLVSFGANVAVGGTNRSAHLRLIYAGTEVAIIGGGDQNYGHLGGCIPVLLQPGETLGLTVWTSNTAAAAGAYDNAWLRVAGM